MPVQHPRPATQYGKPYEVTSVRKIEPYWVEMFDGSGEKKVLFVLCGRGEDTRIRFLDLTNSPALGSLRQAGSKLYEALRGHIDGISTEVEPFEKGEASVPEEVMDRVMALEAQ